MAFSPEQLRQRSRSRSFSGGAATEQPRYESESRSARRRSRSPTDAASSRRADDLPAAVTGSLPPPPEAVGGDVSRGIQNKPLDNNNKIYVGAKDVTYDDLVEWFSPFGRIVNYVLNPKFAFIEMSSKAESEAAIAALDGTLIHGVPSKIRFGLPRRPQEGQNSTFGGGDRRGGAENARAPGSGICYNCGKPGHISRFCNEQPNNARSMHGATRDSNSDRRGDNYAPPRQQYEPRSYDPRDVPRSYSREPRGMLRDRERSRSPPRRSERALPYVLPPPPMAVSRDAVPRELPMRGREFSRSGMAPQPLAHDEYASSSRVAYPIARERSSGVPVIEREYVREDRYAPRYRDEGPAVIGGDVGGPIYAAPAMHARGYEARAPVEYRSREREMIPREREREREMMPRYEERSRYVERPVERERERDYVPRGGYERYDDRRAVDAHAHEPLPVVLDGGMLPPPPMAAVRTSHHERDAPRYR